MKISLKQQLAVAFLAIWSKKMKQIEIQTYSSTENVRVADLRLLYEPSQQLGIWSYVQTSDSPHVSQFIYRR